jgi:hypothetical protein
VCEEIERVLVSIRYVIVTADSHLTADILTFTYIGSLKLCICVFHGEACVDNFPFMLL